MKLGLPQDTSEASAPLIAYEGQGDTATAAGESRQWDASMESRTVNEPIASRLFSLPSSVIGNDDLAPLMLEPIADITIDPHSPDTDADTTSNVAL
jgi:hypothetical protein